MGLMSFISGIIKPATELVDELHTSEEEKLSLRAKLMEIENQLQLKILEYETKLMQAQKDVITAESTGQSWMQRNWRPITMLTFLVLVVCDSFGFLKFRLADEAWTLLQIGLGGYVVGRSAEKIVPQVMKKNSSDAKG
ncbi:MAG: hypothetical protein H6696_07010 [Deferribacteres bacterium]|nr:hypothetical protein [candidate division KSB1 bacterium]MCB9501671.1 hypothetical protein [Deferribacteres bacterium]